MSPPVRWVAGWKLAGGHAAGAGAPWLLVCRPAPAERVAHILQLGPCHRRHLDPLPNLRNQRPYTYECVSWKYTAPEGRTVIFSFFWRQLSEFSFPFLKTQHVPASGCALSCWTPSRPERQPSLSNSHKVSLWGSSHYHISATRNIHGWRGRWARRLVWRTGPVGSFGFISWWRLKLSRSPTIHSGERIFWVNKLKITD